MTAVPTAVTVRGKIGLFMSPGNRITKAIYTPTMEEMPYRAYSSPGNMNDSSEQTAQINGNNHTYKYFFILSLAYFLFGSFFELLCEGFFYKDSLFTDFSIMAIKVRLKVLHHKVFPRLPFCSIQMNDSVNVFPVDCKLE